MTDFSEPPGAGAAPASRRPAAGAVGRSAAPRATLGSVAALAGVSKQTVSNVINAPQMVRGNTASRVNAAITQLGYRPHRAAAQLRTRRSRVLGLRIPNRYTDAVFDRFLHALTDAAGALDYRIMLYTADDDTAEIRAYDELLDGWDIDGFVLTGTHPGDERTSYLSGAAVPCVTFGRPWDDSGHHPWVDVDGAAGTRAATEHLISHGHRRIGFLGWPDSSGVGGDRLAGWAGAISAAGLPALEPSRAVNDAHQGRAAAAALLDHTQPTAIVCASDVLALGAISEITARGMEVGRQIAVVGFDDTDISEVSGLSSLAQPLVEVALQSARLIAALLERPADGPPEHVLLPPTLVTRASSAAFLP
jgi:DNA-binding LacI/PurR family transcriptional regulator